MARVNDCNIPEELYYNIDKHVWARIEPDGIVTMGITDVAQHMAGRILYANIKRPGKTIEQGRSAGTIESGKFVGPVPAPVSGEIVAVNEALGSDPTLINQDAYGRGWIVRMRPTNLETEKTQLLTGTAAVQAYQAKMQQENLGCTKK